jgi:adenylate cyclase, class 2
LLAIKKNLILIEVEVKIRIADLDLLHKKFKHQGGVYKLSLLHEDTYYNMPIGLRDFADSDEALRIRSSTEYDKSKQNSKKTICYFTYKGKKIDCISKSRQEIELKFDDAKSMREILTIIGFRETLTVKKERELYEFEYKGNRIEALIDYLPALNSYFLEVELTAHSSEELNEKRELLFDFLSLFGYTKEDSIRKSYLELIIRKLMKNNK